MTQEKVDRAIRGAQGQRNRGDYNGARETLMAAVGETTDPAHLGILYHTLGTVEQAAGAYVEAVVYLNIALSRRQEAGDDLGAAYTAFQIPMCRKTSGAPDDFLIEEFREVRGRIQALIDGRHDLPDEHMGNMLQNLAFCCQIERDFAGAIARYNETLSYRYKAKDHRGAAMTLARKAECLLETGQVDNARDNALAALRVFQDLDDVNRIRQVEGTLQKISVLVSNSEGEV